MRKGFGDRVGRYHMLVRKSKFCLGLLRGEGKIHKMKPVITPSRIREQPVDFIRGGSEKLGVDKVQFKMAPNVSASKVRREIGSVISIFSWIKEFLWLMFEAQRELKAKRKE